MIHAKRTQSVSPKGEGHPPQGHTQSVSPQGLVLREKSTHSSDPVTVTLPMIIDSKPIPEGKDILLERSDFPLRVDDYPGSGIMNLPMVETPEKVDLDRELYDESVIFQGFLISWKIQTIPASKTDPTAVLMSPFVLGVGVILDETIIA